MPAERLEPGVRECTRDLSLVLITRWGLTDWWRAKYGVRGSAIMQGGTFEFLSTLVPSKLYEMRCTKVKGFFKAISLGMFLFCLVVAGRVCSAVWCTTWQRVVMAFRLLGEPVFRLQSAVYHFNLGHFSVETSCGESLINANLVGGI